MSTQRSSELSRSLKALKKKLSARRSTLNKEWELEKKEDAVDLILVKNERDKRRLLKKVKKLVKAHKPSLISELCKPPAETSQAADEAEFDEFVDDDDDDLLGYKEDIEGPKNDYNQHFVDTGERAQNFIRDPGLCDRFEEYPKLRELIKLKDDLIARSNLPRRPMYIKASLAPPPRSRSLLDMIGGEFDVILVEPPLLEYRTTNGVHFDKYYSWDEIKSIDVGSIAASRSFIFLWCGAGDGLDRGRECLKSWGFRRCEDICWIKTNKRCGTRSKLNIEGNGAIFQRTKEHCLMGIKGTVRRSVDSDFIHTNIDIDLIITEDAEYGKADKPREIFHIIEHFCLGKRRLYLFGRDSTIRHGWLTVGPDLSDTNFDKEAFRASFDLGTSGNLTGSSERIEMLRPKTPPPKQSKVAPLQPSQSQQQQLQSPQPPPSSAPSLQFMEQQQQHHHYQQHNHHHHHQIHSQLSNSNSSHPSSTTSMMNSNAYADGLMAAPSLPPPPTSAPLIQNIDMTPMLMFQQEPNSASTATSAAASSSIGFYANSSEFD